MKVDVDDMLYYRDACAKDTLCLEDNIALRGFFNNIINDLKEAGECILEDYEHIDPNWNAEVD